MVYFYKKKLYLNYPSNVMLWWKREIKNKEKMGNMSWKNLQKERRSKMRWEKRKKRKEEGRIEMNWWLKELYETHGLFQQLLWDNDLLSTLSFYNNKIKMWTFTTPQTNYMLGTLIFFLPLCFWSWPSNSPFSKSYKSILNFSIFYPFFWQSKLLITF